ITYEYRLRLQSRKEQDFMQMTISKHGDVPVLRLKGKLSVLGADEFEQKVLAEIDGGAQRLLFVMDELDYISSAGLRVFYLAMKRLDDDASRLSFAGITPDVRSIFDVIGLSPLVKIFATEAEALADLDASAKP